MKLANIINITLLTAAFQFMTLAQGNEIVAYYPEWGVSHQPYYVKYVETSGAAKKITVLNFAFVEPGPDSAGNIIPKFMNALYDYQQVYTAEMSVDGVADDSTQAIRGQFNQLKKLKALHPGLKILLAVGGWTGSVHFSDAALTPDSREKFVNYCIDKFIVGNLPKANNAGGAGVAAGIFDGFDIDWEFPVEGGVEGIHHNKADKENLTALVMLLRAKLNAINPKFLLTMAVSARVSDLWKFNTATDQKYLDWYNVMTYDFHGTWEQTTNHHANLFVSPMDPTGGAAGSFDNTIHYMLDSLKIPKSKLVPGVAFYGRGWKDAGPVNAGLFQTGSAAPGVYDAGFSYYNDLHTKLKHGYERHWDDGAMAPYYYNPTDKIFWSLDDAKSIALKTRYVDAHQLRGIMFWELSGDDSAGTLVNCLFTRKMPDIKNASTAFTKRSSAISIIAPHNLDKVPMGSDVIIRTHFDDGLKKIAKVEFFADDRSLGYDTEIPFSWVWFNIPAGKHKLKIIATGVDGSRLISNEIQVVAGNK